MADDFTIIGGPKDFGVREREAQVDKNGRLYLPSVPREKFCKPENQKILRDQSEKLPPEGRENFQKWLEEQCKPEWYGF
jgi:hypothetical protein